MQKLAAIASGILSFFFTATALPAIEGVPGNVRAWESLWTGVLAKNVNETGQIDFGSLSRNRDDLVRVVAFIAVNDPAGQPAKFPTSEARLAFYINAYNALAMYGVVEAGIPESFGGLRKVPFFYFRTFSVGGKSISLYNLENDVIRPLGEPRIHFALNCMVISCPRLPRVAFTAEKLDMQLEEAARLFVNESRNVAVDSGNSQIRLSEIFKFYTDDFLVKAPNLVSYINRYRRDPIPGEYGLLFVDYDWTVNRQHK